MPLDRSGALGGGIDGKAHFSQSTREMGHPASPHFAQVDRLRSCAPDPSAYRPTIRLGGGPFIRLRSDDGARRSLDSRLPLEADPKPVGIFKVHLFHPVPGNFWL